MFSKIFCLIFIAAIGVCSSFAQTATVSVSDESWEYLVISIIYLSDKEDFSVADKWIGRRQGKVGLSQDPKTQNELDRIGKLGWQLVGIMPANVNDNPSLENSKFIFKRKLDLARSEREAEELKKLLDEIKTNPPKPINITNLIELDTADFFAQQNEVADKAKARLEQAIKNTSITSIVNLTTRYNSNGKQTYAEIVVDGSSALLKDGNKYRLSEAKTYTRQIAVELFNKIGLKQVSPNEDFYKEQGSGGFSYQGEVSILLSVAIKYNGTTRNITSGYINGNWSEPIK